MVSFRLRPLSTFQAASTMGQKRLYWVRDILLFLSGEYSPRFVTNGDRL